MDEFTQYASICRQIQELQAKIGELGQTVNPGYQDSVNSLVTRASCDFENAKQNLEALKAHMKRSVMANAIDFISNIIVEASKDDADPKREFLVEIANHFASSNLFEYFDDINDFVIVCVNTMFDMVRNDDELSDRLKFAILALVDSFHRIIIGDEYGFFNGAPDKPPKKPTKDDDDDDICDDINDDDDDESSNNPYAYIRREVIKALGVLGYNPNDGNFADWIFGKDKKGFSTPGANQLMLLRTLMGIPYLQLLGLRAQIIINRPNKDDEKNKDDNSSSDSDSSSDEEKYNNRKRTHNDSDSSSDSDDSQGENANKRPRT